MKLRPTTFGKHYSNSPHSIESFKSWADAYEIQMNRILRKRQINELNNKDSKILLLILDRLLGKKYDYILKKYCK